MLTFQDVLQLIHTRENRRRDNFGSFNPEQREVQKEKYLFFAFEFGKCEVCFRISCAFKAREKNASVQNPFYYKEKKGSVSSQI